MAWRVAQVSWILSDNQVQVFEHFMLLPIRFEKHQLQKRKMETNCLIQLIANQRWFDQLEGQWIQKRGWQALAHWPGRRQHPTHFLWRQSWSVSYFDALMFFTEMKIVSLTWETRSQRIFFPTRDSWEIRYQGGVLQRHYANRNCCVNRQLFMEEIKQYGRAPWLRTIRWEFISDMLLLDIPFQNPLSNMNDINKKQF